MTKNLRLLEALRCQPHDGIPIWFMRQAGRYLPGYRRVRAKVDFLTLCRTADLAADVTLEPWQTFGVDAAIIFSDILVPLEAMGIPFRFTDDRGPEPERPLHNRGDIEALRDVDPETDLGYVMDVIREVRSRVAGRIPVIGFAGAPFTLACYALEEAGSRSFKTAPRMVYEAPQDLHRLLDRLATTVTRFLRAQVAAGAQVIQLFDTWGGLLAHDAFASFSLEYCERILAELADCGVPRILFVKGAGSHLDALVRSGPEAVSIDASVDPAAARRVVAGRAAVQGNLAPEALFAPVADLRSRVQALLAVFGEDPGYVFNLGHGILPRTPVERVQAVIDEVRAFRRDG